MRGTKRFEMSKWRSASFLLILAVGSSIAESVQNDDSKYSTLPAPVQDGDSEYSTLPESVRQKPETKSEKEVPDYETALKPATLQKRSIANIARLLLGGNVPPNHPLVQYQDPKAFNLANNMVASFPGGLQGAESIMSEGWARPTALSNIQQLFQTKAKIIPYTGQVATGLTGLASVKGDLLRQIHSISTQAIAQAAAEAAARALATAAAAQQVTNSIANNISPGAQTGIKGGWSSFQNTYIAPPGKTPGEQPGPPYQESAHINHYQPPPSSYNPYAFPTTTPAPAMPAYPSTVGYPSQPQSQPPPNYQNNGYYTLYNNQPNTAQTPYTPAPPAAHARPTLSPNTLIATTPSGYSPSLSKPILPELRKGNSLPVIIYTPGSNNTPLTSFRRAVPADIFGRNAAQPASTSSLLSSISSLLTASTAAYNAALAGSQPAAHQQQPSTLFSTILSAAGSPLPATNPSILRPTSAAAAVSSILSSSLGSAANHNGYQRQQYNTLPQGSSNYGSHPSGHSSSAHFHSSNPASGPAAYPSEARPTSVHPPSHSFNQHVPGHYGASYAQPGANPYASHAAQPSPQFGNRIDGAQPASPVAGNGPVPNYSTIQGNPGQGGFQYNSGSVGPGYPGYNDPARFSSGHVSGWNTQHAGSSPSASTWPAGSANVYPPGYTSPAPGNINHSPGGFGGPAAQFQTPAGSSLAQQTYTAPPPNTYQSPAPNPYAPTQPSPYQPPQFHNPNGYQQPANGNTNGIDRFRNPDISQRYDTQDLSQSASNMGHDYDEDDHYDETHHSNQQAQRRHRVPPNNSYSSSSRYPSPAKKRPSKRPTYNDNKTSHPKSHSHAHHHQHSHIKSLGSHNGRKNVEEKGKRVIPTGSKKGSHLDSAVDVVDASIDEYYYEGDRYTGSEETRNDNTKSEKNRWRSKNPSGQRTHSVHNIRSNGRWTGEKTYSRQAPSKNVRGHGGEPERFRSQSGKSKGDGRKNHGSKKALADFYRKPEKTRHQDEQGKSKTEAAELYRGRVRTKHQQQPTTHKSRDVYTTLPEYVFKVGERPDVFVRPGGKQKHRGHFRGRVNPRVGETDGSSSSDISDFTKEENLIASASNTPYDETFSRGSDSEARLEESSAPSSSLTDTSSSRGEEEESLGTRETVDEASRDDLVNDQPSHTGFITSEEFDPEEREAFVDDVYADEHNHQHSQHSQKYDDEGINSAETINSEIEEDPSEEK